ncbi:hypothetical protein VTH06DRAFT_941 [Thermothelomyces fergusii]
MDKIGNLAASGLASGNRSGHAGTSNHHTNAAGQHNDMGDRVFDAAAKKSGHHVSSGTAEKITDGARGLFEKTTG